jgi:DNA-binding transcriptional LysR family regulator
MNLIELRTFLTIIETGNLVRASEQLNVTQSTVTTRLKSLEDELGQVLINRQKSGASLTAAGVRLQRYASTISDLWVQARQETALPDAMNAVCNIACHPDLWTGMGSKMFDYIRAKHPSVALSVWQGNQSDLTNWLNAGLTDISLTYWPNANQKQSVSTLTTDKLVLVSTRPNSPMKFDPDYIFVEAGDEFGQQHASAYADADTARISFGTAQLGLEYLLEKGGSAYLPMRIAETYINSGDLFLLTQAPTFERTAFMIANKTALKKWTWFDECLKSITP